MNGFLYLNFRLTIWLVQIEYLSLLSCCTLRKDKECAKLIVVIHVIPAHNTEGFSPSI
jgi:hypothetical protein